MTQENRVQARVARPRPLSSGTTATVNGATVGAVDLDALLHAVDEFRGNRKRVRTATVIEMMRSQGFDPDGDLCFINADLRDAFNDHPCFRWSPYVKEMCFISRRLLQDLGGLLGIRT